MIVRNDVERVCLMFNEKTRTNIACCTSRDWKMPNMKGAPCDDYSRQKLLIKSALRSEGEP